jgi:hypothetical protein
MVGRHLAAAAKPRSGRWVGERPMPDAASKQQHQQGGLMRSAQSLLYSPTTQQTQPIHCTDVSPRSSLDGLGHPHSRQSHHHLPTSSSSLNPLQKPSSGASTLSEKQNIPALSSALALFLPAPLCLFEHCVRNNRRRFMAVATDGTCPSPSHSTVPSSSKLSVHLE